jgi:hypothetical protein
MQKRTVNVNYTLNTTTNNGVPTGSVRLVPPSVQALCGRGRGGEDLTPPHKIWVKANTLVKTRANDYHDCWGQGPQLRQLAKQYTSKTRSTHIILKDKTNGKVITRPYTTRFDPNYGKKVKRRYTKRTSVFTNGLFLSGTLDPKNYNNVHDALTHLQHITSNTLAAIRKGYGPIQFVRAIETQENGNPHVHMVITGPNVKHIREQWLQKIWSKNGGGTIKVKQIYDPRGAVYYLLKYLPKDWDTEPNMSLVVLWANHTKQWTSSLIPSNSRLTQTGCALLSSVIRFVLVGFAPVTTLSPCSLVGNGG